MVLGAGDFGDEVGHFEIESRGGVLIPWMGSLSFLSFEVELGGGV